MQITKKLSIYLLAIAGLIALATATTTLADDPIIPADQHCWEVVELGDRYTDNVGSPLVCQLNRDRFEDYLDHFLPPIDETYDTRENYIEQLYNDMVDGCCARRAGGSTSACRSLFRLSRSWLSIQQSALYRPWQ